MTISKVFLNAGTSSITFFLHIMIDIAIDTFAPEAEGNA
jgi:hypothetical protein